MYIYKTTNIINGKIYVGLSKFKPEENVKYLGSGFLIKRAIECYGKENFKKEILEECNSPEHLCERERYWISLLRSNERTVGYNICEGGTWGDNWTNNPRKEELRLLFKIKNKGSNNGNYGNRWTDRQKEIASERAKREKYLIDPNTGTNIAKRDDIRKKLSETKLAEKNPRSCIWRLISPINEVYIFVGGVNNELKKYNLTYSQFKSRQPLQDGIMINGKGWKLEKIIRNENNTR